MFDQLDDFLEGELSSEIDELAHDHDRLHVALLQLLLVQPPQFLQEGRVELLDLFRTHGHIPGPLEFGTLNAESTQN